MENKVSKEGYARLQEKYNQLYKELDKIRQEKLVALALSGDGWHDNPYFNKMEQDERAMSIRVSEVKAALDSAVIVEGYQRNITNVALNSIVECKCRYDDEEEEETEVFEIVSSLEADLNSKKLNIESLVAKNIMGMGIGEKRAFDTPGGSVVYEVIRLYSDWSEVDADK